MMRRLLQLSSLAVLASGCAATRPAFTLDVPIASKYMFRGAVVDDDAVIQPSLSAEQELRRGVLSAALWSNLELSDDRDEEGEFTEVDTTLDYSFSAGSVDLSVGASHYRYPHTDTNPSTELYTLLSLSGLCVTPGFEVWYDVDDIDGVYFNLNVSRGVELGPDWTLDGVVGVGWMDSSQAEAFFGVDSSGLSDALLQLTLGKALTESVSFALVGAAATVLDGDFRDAADDPDNVWFAAGVSWSF